MSKKNDSAMFKLFHTITIKSVVSILLIVTACAVPHPGPVCDKDQKHYGVVDGTFRSRWWNYYQRGQSYLEGECLKAAISDFHMALAQKDQDQRMIRTYGMHFVDYFPHRELGFVYYLLGDLDEAQKELNQSISQESSAKALYYLDQIRKKQMQKEGQKINTPFLEFTQSNTHEKQWTRDEHITIQGIATDDQYVSDIQINNEPVDLKESAKRVCFKKDIVLPQGIHHIPIQVKNLLGGCFTQDYVAYVDHQGPLIEILVFEQIRANTFHMEGMVSDISGTVQLSLDQKKLDLSGEKKQNFNVTHTVTSHKNELILSATDEAGNETHAVLNISEATQILEKHLIASREDTYLYAKQSKKMNITLSDWKQTNTVYSDKIYLEGYISSASPLEKFMINQTPIAMNKGQLVFFNIPVQLNKGKNDIQLTVKNQRKEILIQRLSFTRMTPEISKLDARLHVAMNQLKASEDVSDARNSFQEMMLTSFIQRNRFYVIPKFSRNNAADPSAFQTNEMQISHVTLSGQYIDSRYGVEVSVRMVDNETTRVMTVKDTYSENKDKAAITRMVDSLSFKIHNEFPIVKASIQQIKDNIIQISLGKHQLKAQNRLIIFQPSEINMKPELVGFAKITEIDSNSSKLMIIHTKRPLSLTDRVITQ
ncbi:MAG: hypothetical protein HQK75_09950 [Candidatus Magnetomorum sp.]|nr:hypothetical protein [Candidatus Magnetomorum sp.]